jgi:3-oxoacyl-[acyl-carrier protein] reductase
MEFKNKVALVTGASKGIGAAIAYDLASHGCNVVINYNNAKVEAEHLRDEVISKFGVKALIVKCDISKEDEVNNMVEEVLTKFGKIDILVNNAGIAIDTLVEDKNTNDFRKILDVNLIGTFLVSRLVASYMLKNSSGKIINIASTNGIDTYYSYSLDYDASKAGVISLTHNLAEYYKPYITVNAVAPGWVNTPMNKELDKDYVKEECKKIMLGRFADPLEIAKAVTFLASDEASYINNTVIRVDGGLR